MSRSVVRSEAPEQKYDPFGDGPLAAALDQPFWVHRGFFPSIRSFAAFSSTQDFTEHLVSRFRPRPAEDEVRSFTARGGQVSPVPIPSMELGGGGAAELFGAGASIILQKVDAHDPSLAALCAALEAMLLRPAQLNLYCSPPGTEGLPPHRDPHDVLLIQLFGTKTFSLEIRRGAALAPVILHSGDVLLLPRGHLHTARSGDTGSVHLSLGLLHLTSGATITRSSNLDDETLPLLRQRTHAPGRQDEVSRYLAGWRPGAGSIVRDRQDSIRPAELIQRGLGL